MVMKKILIIFSCLILSSCYQGRKLTDNKTYNTIQFAKKQRTFKNSLIKRNKKCGWKPRKGTKKRLNRLYESQRKPR